MEQRIVGMSGLRVSSVGIGCNNFGWLIEAGLSRQIIHKALDVGITLFDTSPVYGANGGESEEILGEALGARRKDVVINTKFGLPPGRTGKFNASRGAIMTEIEASLKRLRTDFIDIYMMHFPDPSTPLPETLRALDDIVTSGKARYIACSNTLAWQVVEAKWISKTDRLHSFIVAQNEYSLVQRDCDTSLIPALKQYGVGFMPYGPLASGLLSGKYLSGAAGDPDGRITKNTWNAGKRYLTESKMALAEKLNRFAVDRGHTLIELAICWLLSNPLICSVIAGATKVEQVASNAAADMGWRLSAEELAEVDKICRETAKATA